MSRTETHFGKIKKVKKLKGESFLDTCLRLWKKNGKTRKEFTSADDLFDTFYEKYLLVGIDIWEILEDKEIGDEGDDFCNLTPNEDGTLSFSSQFHNGGTCLNEMLGEAIEELETK